MGVKLDARIFITAGSVIFFGGLLCVHHSEKSLDTGLQMIPDMEPAATDYADLEDIEVDEGKYWPNKKLIPCDKSAKFPISVIVHVEVH